MAREKELALGGASKNDNDEDGTDRTLIEKIEHLAARAADLGFARDHEGAGEILRELLPLCRKLGAVKLPHLYQTGTEYAAQVERVLAREHKARRL